MAITIPASITGGAQTGFTAPVYTMLADSGVDNYTKQSYVSALGGTQAGVTVHSVQSPFTVSVRRPAALKLLLIKFLNGVTGKYTRVPRNIYTLLTRKGVLIQSGQYDLMMVKTLVDVPAGAETFDIANCRAAVAAHVGLLSGVSAGIGDTVNTGTV